MQKLDPSYRSITVYDGLRSLVTAVVCTLFLVNPGRAQVSTNYNFSQSAGSYSAITGGTVLWGGTFGSFNDEVSGAITIPGFNFDGTVYTQMYVSANGFITFGSAPSGTNYTPLSSTAGYSGAISAFGANLNSSGFTPTVRWQSVGSEIVVQWTSARRFNLAGTFGLNPEGFNMQIRLNTADNTISMVYGSISNQNSATTFQPQVGLRGANNTFPDNLNNRRVGTGAENWANSLAGNANNSTMRFTSGSPAKAFTNGLTYTWTPSCTAPTASVSLTTNCATNSYTATVSVTSLGSASSVDLIGSVSGLFANDVGIGNYTTPSITFGTSQTITVVHNTSSVCSIQVAVTSPSGSCTENGTCLSPTLAIPDNGCGAGNRLNALIPITAPGTSLNTDVLFGSVDLIVAHTWNNDLEITLTSPGGQTRNLVLDRFGNGDNLGNPATCPSSVLRLRDGGTTLSNANTSNVTGEYAPEQTLAGFTGNPNGLWTLRICDDANLDIGSLVYVKLNFTVMASTDRCAPQPLTCGSAVQANSTSGAPNTLPPTACAFNGAASTGGTHWWSHTPFSSGEVVVTLCGSASFNTRLSIFTSEPSCTSPTCIAMSDDSPGCPGGSSEVRFKAQAGTTYLIAVHGSGAAVGTYTINLFCQSTCSPAATNDLCANAAALNSVLDDGNGVPMTYDNSCAHVDGPTSTSGADPVIGLWFAFNSGDNTRHRLHLLTQAESGAYSANTMSYALYSGTCSGLGASGALVSVASAAGVNDLPVLTPNTDYLLLVYNKGGVSQSGSFGILLDHPAVNDAALTSISSPTGVVCGSVVIPVVTLENAGEAPLTSALLTVEIDNGGALLTYLWTGNLASGASEEVTLAAVNTPSGAHGLSVTVSQPNGQPDGIASDNVAVAVYDASGHSANVIIRTDDHGTETTWTIFDAFFFPVASGGPYASNTTNTTTVCLPSVFGDCFSLYIFDSGGDGLCCTAGTGYWELNDGLGHTMLRDEFVGTFDGAQSPPMSPQSTGYTMGHEFCLPVGPSDILANECGIFTNNLLNKVYCETVPGATMYQFEFSDPDAGFLRRIGVPRPWVAFGEMVTTPLLPGVRYFTRVRVDQGTGGFFDDRFGGGCEMGIDPVQVPGCTQLIDDPSLPTHSCGATKTFGGSDKIWAVPVVGGTAYRFNFSNPDEGYNRTIQRHNYVCILNWVTQPLLDGQYDVTVSVLVNGQWSGYCGAACQLNIFTPPANNMEGRMAEAVETTPSSELQVYPNPVTDGQVMVRMEGLTDEMRTIQLDVMDLQGKAVMNEQFTNEGDVINRRINLPTGLKAGSYVLRLVVDGEVITDRILVM